MSSNSRSYMGTSGAHLSRTVFTWKIDKFSYRNEKLRSPIFAHNKEHSFQLKLYTKIVPNKDTEEWNLEAYFGSPKYIWVEIKLYTFGTINIKYTLSLLDAQGKIRFYDENFGELTHLSFGREYQYPWETSKFIIDKVALKKDVLDPEKGYLLDDTLTLHCEIFELKNEDKLLTLESDNGERIMKTLSEDYGCLLKNGNLADVDLIVGGKTIRAHKSILAIRSPVFAAMFSHDTKEQQENQVEIPDVSLEAFEALLEFLYTGKVPSFQVCKSAEDLLIAADKYGTEQLKSICEDHLIINLTLETAPNLLLLANSVNAPKLKASSVEFMRGRGSELFDALQNDPDQMVNLFQCLAMKNQEKEKEKEESN